MESDQALNNICKCILVIGPSGVGKSKICQKLARDFGYKYVDLDQEAKVHDDSEYPKRGMEIIHEIEAKKDGKIYIVDIGAGFQNREDLFEFFKERKNRLLCIYAPPEIAYKRNIRRSKSYWSDKTLDAYKKCEYSEYRERLYSLGEIIINTDFNYTIQKIRARIERFCIIK